MIESITLKNVATYSDEELSDLKRVNYFFGSNGSGKSTIGRVIKESSKYENCKVVWENNNPLEVLVYNTAFVDEYFLETDVLKGIFTLGKENVSLSTQINETKSSLNNINADLIQLKNTLNNKKEELNDLEKSYLDKFWKKWNHIRTIS